MTKEEAALKLFQEDVKNELYDSNATFDSLDQEEKDLYIEEAEFYLSGESPIGIPTCLEE